MNAIQENRRSFLRRGLGIAVGAPLAFSLPVGVWAESSPADSVSTVRRATVSVVRCRTYQSQEVRAALTKAFDLIGGIGGLVRNKTVTVKLNLTGTNFTHFLGRPVGETYMTHPATVMTLVECILSAGARRVRLVESTNSRAQLESTLALADWDVRALSVLGAVEFENTRNLGGAKNYARLKVPQGGYMFSAFDVNHSYADTDVLISLAKLKNHITAGVTLTMKNLFGITPNALYGDEAGNEDGTGGRGPLHDVTGFERIQLPGLKPGINQRDQTWRIPHIVADICGARPIDLAVIDGITSMSGGEGPWCGDGLKFTAPGVLVAGLNPVSTDAVGTALMGYDDPRGARGTKPFQSCDNHLLLAEQAGAGTADLNKIEIRGLTIAEARCNYG